MQEVYTFVVSLLLHIHLFHTDVYSAKRRGDGEEGEGDGGGGDYQQLELALLRDLQVD